MRVALAVLAISLGFAVPCAAETIVFPENLGREGLAVESISESWVDVSFRLERVTIEDVDLGDAVMQQILISGVFLPNNEGAPNLPGVGRFIALPVGATAELEILSTTTQTVHDLDVLPAPDIPKEGDDSPVIYRKDPLIYSADEFYPQNPVGISEEKKMRGVDVVALGITPFQYNPVTRDLVVYSEVTVRVRFVGGSGQFGDSRLRSRYWEPILESNLLNYTSLPEVVFDRPPTRDNEYEYVIIVPDDATYIAWADSIRHWRTLQGIDAGVVTLTETGATTTAIETWINNAYNTWAEPPAAILLLADYVASGGTTGITSPFYNSYCVSDNIYGDVDSDHLPDIVMARMTATPSTIEELVTKALNYERTPPTDPDFYQNPIVACGWQTERWFTICTEIVYGFLANVHGKTPVREYAIYSGTPGSVWSTNPNTYMLVDYFGPDGLGYIPATPEHLTDWGGNATRLNADINSGAFILQHRDHGGEYGWGEPDYDIYDLPNLYNEDLTFVFSINCLTGKYNLTGECFTEVFHRMHYGALGLIAASETSYSFVNDTFIFGLYDCMWPEFDPGYPTKARATGPENLRPAFGNASGKYYLEASNWPYNPDDKEVTYHLFHSHSDAFTTLYSEVPQNLTVAHDGAMPIGATTFTVTADDGSVIALTIDGEIIGVADGTGAPVAVSVTPPTEPGLMTVTVTKVNYYRYSAEVPVIYPVTYDIDPPTVPINTTTPVTVTVWDSEGYPKPDVVLTIDGWGIDAVLDTTDVAGQATLAVTPPYGEELTVVGRAIGETYNCLNDVLPVTGGTDFAFADVEASVPSIGLYGSLAPYYEGTIEGTATETGFTLYAVGCGVDTSTTSRADSSTVVLLATPTSTGTIETAVAKGGFNLYLEDVTVQVVYGQLAGEVYEDGGGPIAEAHILGFTAGADTSVASPVFDVTSGPTGDYTVEGDLEIGYYDVYVSKFGYLPYAETIFVQYGANDVDYSLTPAPSGTVSGTVTEVSTGHPLTASVRVYRADTMELYTETESDSLAAGQYSTVLPYFNYVFKVRARHYMPVTQAVTVDEPTETVDFVLEPTLANILVVSDGGTKQEDVKIDKTGAVIDVNTSEGTGDAAADEFAEDLIEIGYDVTEETASTTDPLTWPDYDVVIWSSGNNTSPVSQSTWRTAMEDYVAAHHKLLIEGGETAYDAASYPGYPSFATNVLHVIDWEHDSSGSLTLNLPAHPIATTPNTLPATLPMTYAGYGDQDACIPDGDTEIVYDWSSYSGQGGILVYDDNPDPGSSQIVFFSFNYAAVTDTVGRRELLENAITHFMTPETEPKGMILGQVTLYGESNFEGVIVQTHPMGLKDTTDVAGNYVIPGLYDGTYQVTANKISWSDSTRVVEIAGGATVKNVDFTLFPILEYMANPEMPIPDNTPAGIRVTLDVPDSLLVEEVDCYVNLSHTYIGDLIVELTSPKGTTVRLHNRTGGAIDDIVTWYDLETEPDGPGTMDDFAGDGAQGTWELFVSDNAGYDTGTLHSWGLRIVTPPVTPVADEIVTDVPRTHFLAQNFPNPFNPVTHVRFGLPRPSQVDVSVYNVAGQRVAVLASGPYEAGVHAVSWDGTDGKGHSVASGIYFCRMKAEDFTATQRMVLMK